MTLFKTKSKSNSHVPSLNSKSPRFRAKLKSYHHIHSSNSKLPCFRAKLKRYNLSRSQNTKVTPFQTTLKSFNQSFSPNSKSLSLERNWKQIEKDQQSFFPDSKSPCFRVKSKSYHHIRSSKYKNHLVYILQKKVTVADRATIQKEHPVFK